MQWIKLVWRFANFTIDGSTLVWLGSGMSHDKIIADFPELTDEDIRACLAYAADRERRLLTAAE